MNRLCDSPRREAFVFVSAPLGQTFSSFRCTVVSQCINFVCLRNVRRWGYLCKYISQNILLKKGAVDWIGPRRILGVFEILRFTRSARKPLGLPPSIGETIQLSNNKFPSNTFPKFEMWFPKSKFTVQQVLILLYIDIMIDSIWLRKNFFVGINYTCASLCSLPIPVCRRKIFKLQNEKLSWENILKKKTLAWDKDREQRRKSMETFGN